MKDLFYKSINPQGKPFLWSHRRWTQEPFDGYYHWHWGFEMLFVHQGSGVVIVNQRRYEMRPGSLFFFLPNQLHKVQADINEERPYERSIIHFEPAFLERFLPPFPSLRDSYMRMKKGLLRKQSLELSACQTELGAAFDSFQGVIHDSGAGGGEEEGAAILLLQLLAFIQRGIAEPIAGEGVKPIRHSDEIMAWIERHYSEPFQLDKLAAELHMSGSYLSRLFRQETGSSITGYLAARRIQQACSLLRGSDKPIELIGQQVGLPNVSYFIQLFKRTMGISPHQYRLKL
ncbi:AraC family transcriptional regulator [Paenibacillus sp. PAMC21692]|uniref:helix-turn-helix domain-containing protein n=1 Tax=Paenibacillus sp. PAMC21692 TaxID=2762320 RepID=UPI00164D9607|nr:AraC family transcriptional regulator [Paenibacillus sp. PAMC21692]QNK54459.1 AraC family transcriptional regulator [Paenibacillus sp. PAMC21692]